MPYKTAIGPIYDAASSRRRWTRRSRCRLGRIWNSAARVSQNNGQLPAASACAAFEVAGGILNEKADLRFENDGSGGHQRRRAGDGAGPPHDLSRVIAKRLGIDIRPRSS